MGKKAIGYVRISTSDQSNFSLDGQEEYIRNYCAKQGLELHAIFKDDGQSAKNFDRANWKELEKFIRANHHDVDMLIVSKYDRFSRNVADALVMMEKLEKKYSITVSSVMEPIAMHPASPYYFQFRTQMLLGADVELRVIRDRTKFGLVTAASNGRFVATAPIGYKNARDEKNKPIIVVDENKAALIRRVYELFLQGMPMAEIKRTMKPEGLNMKGNSAIPRILSYPIYAGLIKVPAYYDEPERMVKGIHQAIIEPDVWWHVQAIINKPPVGRTIMNEAVPLRGVLHCQCGKCFTAGESRGKSKKYWYYRCNEHSKQNFSAIKLHAQFDELIKHLQLPEQVLQELTAAAAADMKERMEERELKLRGMRKDLAAVTLRLESLEEKYLDNILDSAAYKKWRIRLEHERHALQEIIDDNSAPVARIWDGFSKELWRLRDIHYLYQRANLQGKQAFVRLVFNNKLSYSGGIYRTPYLLPIFSLKAALLAEKNLLRVEQVCGISGEIPVGSGNGS